MEDSVADAATTVNEMTGLILPSSVAVISVLPTAMPVARPAAEIVAIPGDEVCQVT